MKDSSIIRTLEKCKFETLLTRANDLLKCSPNTGLSKVVSL